MSGLPLLKARILPSTGNWSFEKSTIAPKFPVPTSAGPQRSRASSVEVDCSSPGWQRGRPRVKTLL